MTDKLFFQHSIQIFESYVFNRPPNNMEVYNEHFWATASEKIKEALNQNPRIVLLLKLIYIEEKITENTLLDLLFSTICKTKSLNNKLVQKPDEWGRGLIWPFYEGTLIKLEDWASPNEIRQMLKSVEIEKLTHLFNDIPKNDTFKEFPKTYKSIGSYLGK